MRIALLTSDNRESSKTYTSVVPCMGIAPEALLQGFSSLPDVEINVISCLQQPVPVPEQHVGNIHYHALHVPKAGWLRTGYQGCIRGVRRKVSELQPDLVHGQGTERDCAISAVLSGFPNVITIHGNMRAIARVNRARPFSFLWLAARLERFILPRTAGVVCPTHYTFDAVRQLTPKAWVLPNAVDQSFFKVVVAPDPAGPPIGLCVGTICHHKNQNDFIRALDWLAKERPFRIVFLGQREDDAYGNEFMRLIKDRPWCEYAGYANREQLKSWLTAATFLAHPTREDNCPMVVLEAMAAGVAVMASSIGGIPDLITDCETGLFGNPQHPESFAAGVLRLLDDRNFAQNLTINARAQALQRFHPDIIARRHVEIYREVLARVPPSA